MLSQHRGLWTMTGLKNRFGVTITAIILIVSVLLLAGNVGLWLYNPSRFASVLSSCVLSILRGTAEVQTPDTITWEEARNGMKLEPGSRVSTGTDSHALLTFSEDTTTKLEPGTDLLVAKLEGSRDNYPDVILLRQWSGRTWSQVERFPDNRHYFEIQTPSASVMARSTLFGVNVDKSGRTLIQTTEGQVDVIAQGQEVRVSAGQQTGVELGAPPSVPVRIPPVRNELLVTVGTPAVGMVMDPHGSRTGYLPNGAALNQIPGSRSSVREESGHIIRIPEPSSGEYTVVLRGVDAGTADFSIEALAEGKSTFKYAGSTKTTAASEWVLRLRVDVFGGLLQRVSVVDPQSPRGKVSGDTAEARIRTTKTGQPEPTTNYPDSEWLLASKKGWLLGYWAAAAILMIFLGMIFARLYRWR